MKPWNEIDDERLARVEILLSDIDDTFSSEGKIRPEAYAALWRLREAGIKIVMVTGRPAGWCDHIGRFWPVDAVIGENGGFYFYHDGEKLQQRFVYSDEERTLFRERLLDVREQILKEIPGAGIASDQNYREYDLAIDFCEDVDPLPRDQITRIKEIFEEAGAHAKISSIHVNGWFGDFDKLSTTRLILKELFAMDFEQDKERLIYCGDSPNDEPMFEAFDLSVGMANLRPMLEWVEHQPTAITEKEAGLGFVEVAERLLKHY